MNTINKLKDYNTYSTSDLIQNLLLNLGEDPEREGLINTPKRVEKALAELTSGYEMSLTDVIGEGVFKSESSGIISVKNIDFFSLCEHHLLPFWGQISIAYIPNDKIIGLSKFAKLIEMFSRRLQVQERLTREIVDNLNTAVSPKAIYIKVEAQHMCMMMRGVKKANSLTTTEYTLGIDKISDNDKFLLLNSFK